MVGVYGIGGVPEPAHPRQPPRRDPATEPGRLERRDDVAFSTEAVQASQGGTLAASASESDAIRAERIAKAKENIEQGVYRIHEVVLQVADRIAQFVD